MGDWNEEGGMGRWRNRRRRAHPRIGKHGRWIVPLLTALASWQTEKKKDERVGI